MMYIEPISIGTLSYVKLENPKTTGERAPDGSGTIQTVQSPDSCTGTLHYHNFSSVMA